MRPAALLSLLLCSPALGAGLPVRAVSPVFPPALRPQLRAYLLSPSSGGSELLPVLEELRRLPPLAAAPLSDPSLGVALGLKAAALSAAAAPGSAPEALRRSHQQLGLLQRELAPWVSAEMLAPVAEARQRTAAALESRLLASLDENAGLLDPARDARPEYDRAWEQAVEPWTPAQVARLRGYRVVFAPGLFADVYRRHGVPYFDDAIADLRAAGVEAVLVPYNTQGRVRDNAQAIAAELARSERPVLVVTHSKGGLDLLHALIHVPGAREKVAAWGALQAPFSGSPVAGGLLRRGYTRWLAARLLSIWDGSLLALRDLTPRLREAYMRRRAGAVAALTATIPVLSIVTWTRPQPWRWDVLHKPIRDHMHRRGRRNDGLVPVDAGVLPGSDAVVLEGLDHKAPVMPSGFTPMDRTRFNRALLSMLLDRAERSRAP